MNICRNPAKQDPCKSKPPEPRSRGEKCFHVCHIWKNTELKTFPEQTQTSDLYHSVWQWNVCLLCEILGPKLKGTNLWTGRGGRKETKGVVLVKCTDACCSVLVCGTTGCSHRCGRRLPAIPRDSCRFLEPRRVPRSCSPGDRSLHGDTHGETGSEMFKSFSYTNTLCAGKCSRDKYAFFRLAVWSYRQQPVSLA